MSRQLDASPRISRFLRWLSTTLAKYRGLPMLLGTILVVMSCVGFGLVLPVLVSAEKIDSALLWLCIPLGVLHLGIFLGFLGFMLSAPLGEAFRSSE